MPEAKKRKVALMGSRSVNLHGSEYELYLVDTAGQDEYSIMPPEYSVDVHGYVLVYSIDSMKSLEVCQTLHEKLIDLIGNNNVPIVLVGNKCDLHADRQVSSEEGRRLAAEIKAVFLETSAKNNQNVADVFHKVLSEMEKDSGTLDNGEKKCVIS
eukprot:TCALIF_02483-PA protein Name:"Similar to RHEB GTP-binding protein Rheb (Bos taurus)" AED:0.18 eAED:0.18 QI:0/0/0/1/1/1/4/0/154